MKKSVLGSMALIAIIALVLSACGSHTGLTLTKVEETVRSAIASTAIETPTLSDDPSSARLTKGGA